MLKLTLKKEIVYKLFMFVAFGIFAMVMYQGHIQKGGIYSILLIISFLLMAFQIASIFYVIFTKREWELTINDKTLTLKIFDNKKVHKEQTVNLEDIEDTQTEINYLTGNIYSNFTITFTLKNNKEMTITDGMLFDLGLEKAEEICRFLLKHNLGHKQDVRFSKLVNELNIDTTKDQKFSKNEKESRIVGVISKNKKEFLALRLQLEHLYPQYNIPEKNSNNEYLIKPANSDSFIYLRSNAIGYMVEFYKVDKKVDLKMLNEFKGATLKNKLANITKG